MKRNKPHALAGRKRSPEAIAKSVATRKANLEAKRNGSNSSSSDEQRIKDAIVLLRHANRALDRGLERCLLELAIHTLRGTV